MKKATRINLGLGALLLLMGLALSRPPTAERALLYNEPVKTARIEHAGKTTDFQRDRCGWIQTQPQRVRANAQALDRLASMASAIPQRRYAAAALAPDKLGFSAATTITLNQQRVVLGGVEPINGWRYLRLPDGSVALLTDRFSDLLTKDLSEPNLTLECPDA